MTDFPNPSLAAWQSFYVIVGPSAGALIGVQFVVITLIVNMPRRTTAAAISAFNATPTVVHLGEALLVSALMSAPWHSLVPSSVALASCGLAGLGYGAVVIRRARRETGYKPVWEDWLWYAVLPCSAYAALAMGAFFLCTTTRLALFTVGAAALALLFIGIHNAWDAVTHMVVTHGDAKVADEQYGAGARAE